MTEEEFRKEEIELKEVHKKELYSLYRKYALANNPYNIGDIVSDHISSIVIEKIIISLNLQRVPSCLYTGTEITKKGVPSKRQLHTKIYQINILP